MGKNSFTAMVYICTYIYIHHYLNALLTLRTYKQQQHTCVTSFELYKIKIKISEILKVFSYEWEEHSCSLNSRLKPSLESLKYGTSPIVYLSYVHNTYLNRFVCEYACEVCAAKTIKIFIYIHHIKKLGDPLPR